jgi:hypothetical protein
VSVAGKGFFLEYPDADSVDMIPASKKNRAGSLQAGSSVFENRVQIDLKKSRPIRP